MQTFLPYANIAESAIALDNKRLNKQILEAYQILNVLSGQSPSGAWRNHPAVLMWKNHEHSLYLYAKVMAYEASNRGIKVDTNLSNLENLYDRCSHIWGDGMPSWYSEEDVKKIVMTHRANLYTKDPIYYKKFKYALYHPDNQTCCEKCKYYWVTHVRK